MKKYPKVRRPGHSSTDGLFSSDSHRLIITEKFDGNNVRFCRDGSGLRFGSRNEDLGVDPDEESTPSMFHNVIEYVQDVVDLADLHELEERWDQGTTATVESIVLYGENAVQHTIDEYDWEEVPQFQLFDVWIEYEDSGGEWCQWSIPDDRKQAWEDDNLLLDDDGLDYYTVEGIADYLGLETTPVVEKTTVGAFDLDEFDVPESVYRTDGGPAEGVVIRNPTTSLKAKLISEEFAERHATAKSGTKSKHPIESETRRENIESFLDRHVTERRIEKNVQTLLEEPSYDYDTVEMEMMADLHEIVWHDVWEEDLEEIIWEEYTLDFDQAHNRAANKCANYLQKLMQSNETPVAVVDPGRGDIVEVDG